MTLVIRCQCGQVVRADSEESLLAAAQAHLADAHPDMVGKISRDDLLAMAQEL
jgi:predicted small metal-binding protein